MAHWTAPIRASCCRWIMPPEAALKEARQLLIGLGALDEALQLTAKGRRMRDFGLPPRLAAMVLDAADHGEAGAAAELAVLLTEQGLGGTDLDLDERMRQFRRDKESGRAMPAASHSGCLPVCRIERPGVQGCRLRRGRCSSMPFRTELRGSAGVAGAS